MIFIVNAASYHYYYQFQDYYITYKLQMIISIL